MLNATIAIVSLLIGWILKEISDRMSEKRLFDHRIRLEKEYGLYSDLWDKLFELRRAVGQLVNSLSSTNTVCHAKDFFNLFNAYQAAVRKGEPFMDTSIFDPANKIATIARRINYNLGKQESLSEPSTRGSDFEALETEFIRFDEEIDDDFKEIERLFECVSIAIRQRVNP